MQNHNNFGYFKRYVLNLKNYVRGSLNPNLIIEKILYTC